MCIVALSDNLAKVENLFIYSFTKRNGCGHSGISHGILRFLLLPHSKINEGSCSSSSNFLPFQRKSSYLTMLSVLLFSLLFISCFNWSNIVIDITFICKYRYRNEYFIEVLIYSLVLINEKPKCRLTF